MLNAQRYLTYLCAVRGVPAAVAAAAKEAAAALHHVHAVDAPEDAQRHLFLAHTVVAAAHVHTLCPSTKGYVTASLQASHAYIARAHHAVTAAAAGGSS